MKPLQILSIFFLFTFFTACGQSNPDRTNLGKKYAESELKATLNEKNLHNVIDNKKNIITDSLTAVKVAEPILMSIYGEDNIAKQRPYEIYLIDNYWVISGTLPKDMMGGTFLMILDAKNGQILRITHGK